MFCLSGSVTPAAAVAFGWALPVPVGFGKASELLADAEPASLAAGTEVGLGLLPVSAPELVESVTSGSAAIKLGLVESPVSAAGAGKDMKTIKVIKSRNMAAHRTVVMKNHPKIYFETVKINEPLIT